MKNVLVFSFLEVFMKSLFFSLFLFSTACLFSMEDKCLKVDFDDIETMAAIREHVLQMLKSCSERCSLVADVTSACHRTCMLDASERTEQYLLRKYTVSCAGIKFEQHFKFNPTKKEFVEELLETNKVYEIWDECPDVRLCAQARLAEYNRRSQSVLRVVQGNLRNEREKHPIVLKFVDFMNAVRRRK